MIWGNEVYHFGYPEFDTSVYVAVNVDVAWHVCFQLSSTPPVRRAASCVEGEGDCQCLCPAEAAVYLFAPGSRRAFAHSSNNKHWWLLTKALVPASPNSGDLEVPSGLPMYPCPWHRDRKCKYSQFGLCIQAHCNIKLYMDGVWLCRVIRGAVMNKDE